MYKFVWIQLGTKQHASSCLIKEIFTSRTFVNLNLIDFFFSDCITSQQLLPMDRYYLDRPKRDSSPAYWIVQHSNNSLDKSLAVTFQDQFWKKLNASCFQITLSIYKLHSCVTEIWITVFFYLSLLNFKACCLKSIFILFSDVQNSINKNQIQVVIVP